jgi:hypothetical protein
MRASTDLTKTTTMNRRGNAPELAEAVRNNKT